MVDDYDSPWKEALDFYLEPALALLFADIHAQIDWSRGSESLDKEFQQIVREGEHGRRYVDKLVRVWLRTGEERWVLIHVEVQTEREPGFPLRMYVYNYRIFDRYNVPVASLAILADDDPNWRPREFRQTQFGCEVGIRFPAVKLLDFGARESELEASDSSFAKFLLAHLKTRQTRQDPHSRHIWKLRLIRGLYEQGFIVKDVRQLFRLIDWLMVLPPPLETRFLQDLDVIQREKNMPYVSTPEKVGHRRGMRQGIRLALKIKFGDAGVRVMPEIEEIHEDDKLREIMDALETATSLDEVRRLWAEKPA